MPESQEKLADKNEFPNDLAEKIADMIEKSLTAMRKFGYVVNVVAEEGKPSYIFTRATEKIDPNLSPSMLDRTATLAVLKTGTEDRERIYFKIFRPNYYKHAGFNQFPELLETGSKDVTIQMYSDTKLVAEIVCKGSACTQKNGDVLDANVNELITGVLNGELRKKYMEEAKVQRDKLAGDL